MNRPKLQFRLLLILSHALSLAAQTIKRILYKQRIKQCAVNSVRTVRYEDSDFSFALSLSRSILRLISYTNTHTRMRARALAEYRVHVPNSKPYQ